MNTNVTSAKKLIVKVMYKVWHQGKHQIENLKYAIKIINTVNNNQ